MTLHPFGTANGGVAATQARLSLPSGFAAAVLDYGARLCDLEVPLADGRIRRVALGYRDLAGYLADNASLGAVCGRYANRIAAGRFTLDGKVWQLTCNEAGRTHLHGGAVGFGKRHWRIVASDETSLTLALTSPAGEEGYPGTLEARCIYRVAAPATLRLELSATTDAPTIVNLAHHPYFSLGEGGPIGNHLLAIDADCCTPTDEMLIPTGEILPVAGGAFDFRSLRPIARTGGAPPFDYDINFVLDGAGAGLRRAATVLAPDHSLRMEVHTTTPGLQLYDGAKLAASHPGLDGRPLVPHAGFCLEPQNFPDAPNHVNFPSAVLRPGEVYRQTTEYRFDRP
jgi:aldose 1-epimerase